MTTKAIDAYFTKIHEYYDNENDLHAAAAVPVYERTEREKGHLHYCCQYRDTLYDSILHANDVLDLENEQRERAWCAARALHRWYERTEYQYCASADLLERLWAYVLG